MLIDILLLSSSEVIVTPNGQSVKTTQLGNSSDACVYTRGSVRRASGFVLTGNTEVVPSQKSASRKSPLISSNPVWGSRPG